MLKYGAVNAVEENATRKIIKVYFTRRHSASG
jgi:hypothetical protein